MVNLCYGEGRRNIWVDAGKHKTNHWGAFSGVIPTGVKRIRMRCPQCGRKMLSSIQPCGDGCHIIHILPPHKPKGWWKKKGEGR